MSERNAFDEFSRVLGSPMPRRKAFRLAFATLAAAGLANLGLGTGRAIAGSCVCDDLHCGLPDCGPCDSRETCGPDCRCIPRDCCDNEHCGPSCGPCGSHQICGPFCNCVVVNCSCDNAHCDDDCSPCPELYECVGCLCVPKRCCDEEQCGPSCTACGSDEICSSDCSCVPCECQHDDECPGGPCDGCYCLECECSDDDECPEGVCDGCTCVPGCHRGSGEIASSFGGTAKFRYHVGRRFGRLKFRRFEYMDSRLVVKGTGLSAYVPGPGGWSAHFEGPATVNGVSGYVYSVDAADNRPQGTADTFAITVSSRHRRGHLPVDRREYSASGALTSGDIELHVD